MESGPSYRQELKSKLTQRCARKPGYSLRAFARDLGYGASQLSRVMNGKQHLSPATAQMLAERLFDSEIDRDVFIAKVEFEGATRPALKDSARNRLERLNSLQLNDETLLLQEDAFHFISDWYHVPILDLMTLHQPPTTHAGVARYLGISQIEAKLAIERLIRLGMLKKDKTRWYKVHSQLYVPSVTVPSQGIRKFHRKMIEKSLDAIEGQAVEQRTFAGRTLALAPKDLPKFRALIDDFSMKLSELSSASKPKTRLYQVNVQMFDLAAIDDGSKKTS